MKPINNKNVQRAKWITTALYIGIVVYVVMIILTVLFYFQVFNWLYENISSLVATGFLGKAITALLMAALFGLPLGKIIKSFLPAWPQKNKYRYRLIAFGMLAFGFFIIYLLRGNDYFDRRTGEPLQYFSIDRDGEYNFSKEGGFDPETGDTLKLFTKEERKKWEEAREKTADSKTATEESRPGINSDSVAEQKKRMIKDFPIHPGKITNKSSLTFDVFLSPDNNKKNLSKRYIIEPEGTVALDLREGSHYFAIFDADGKSLPYHYSGSAEHEGHGWFNPLVINYNGREYSVESLYKFKIDGQKDWSISIENRRITFNP